jgi:anti-sigma factor RsiW
MNMLLRRKPDLVCQQVVELVNDYLEGALSRSDRKRFEAHLRACPHCTTYLAQMRTTIDATGRLAPDDVAPEVLREFTDLFRSWNEDPPPQ